jgi:DNA-binding MarR family transcriptional regulator
MPHQTLPDIERDIVLLLQSCSAALGDRVLNDVRRQAGTNIRFNDGYVFQHLVPGAVSVSELARRLMVTQQAASQQVADLETRGLVRRRPDPKDARSNLVELTRRGWRAIEAGRASREAIAEEITAALGERRTKVLIDGLAEISTHSGAAELLQHRRMRPESDR